MPLTALFLAGCAMLNAMETAPPATSASADAPIGIPVPTDIRDAVPEDCPQLLFCHSFNDETSFDGWTGDYTVKKNSDGKITGITIDDTLTSPELDLSGATCPVICINNYISGWYSNISFSTDGNNFDSCLWRTPININQKGYYQEIPLTTKHIRISGTNLSVWKEGITILDLADVTSGYSTEKQASEKKCIYSDGMIYDYDNGSGISGDTKYYTIITSEAFAHGGARFIISGLSYINGIEVLAHTDNEYIRLPFIVIGGNSNYFVPAGTKDLFAYRENGKKELLANYSTKIVDDLSQFRNSWFGTPIPQKASSWYDINGDGLMDFTSFMNYTSDGIFLSTRNNSYTGVKLDKNNRNSNDGNIINVGGDNGILWYDTYVRHIDTSKWSSTVMDGDASETYHVYYPADVNNDGRYDLLRLNANADVPNPKTFFTLSSDGQSISAKYEVIPLDEYLKTPYKGSDGDIQSALASMSGMGIWSPPVYEKSTGVKFESHDINNDGLPDIVDFVHNKLYYNIGRDGYAATDFGGQIIVRDLNGDGIEDFIIHNTSAKTITSYIQIPEGGVTEKQILSGYYCAGDIYSADLNNDGNVDLLIPISSSSTTECQFILILENKGNGTFKKHECPLPQVCTVFDLRDIDNDGSYDLLLKTKASDYEILQYPIKDCKLAATPVTLDKSAGIRVECGSSIAILPDFNNPARNMIYYKNMGFPLAPYANTLPEAPAKPEIFYEPSTGLLKVTWQPTTDKETPSADLTYSLRIGTAPGLDDVVTADALPDGRRRNLTGGNMGHSLQRKFDTSSWPDGKLYISVQAIDGANGGSKFSEYAMFEKREPANSFMLSYSKPYFVGDTCTVTLTTLPKEGYGYQWDFAGARIIKGDEKAQTYDIVFDAAGEKAISLTVSTSDYTAPTVSTILDVIPGNVRSRHLQLENGSDFWGYWAADIDEDGVNEIFRYDKIVESIRPGVYKDIQRLYNNHSSISELAYGVCTDINGDGHVDILGGKGVGAINQEDKDMEIVTDLFDLGSDWSHSYICYDLNNNGKLDFIEDKVIYYNDNDYKQNSKVSTFPCWPSLFDDYTGDGLIDFIDYGYDYDSKTGESYSFRIYENKGDYTFEPQEPFYAVKIGKDEPHTPFYTVRDFDNNGKLDIMFGRAVAHDTYAVYIRWDDGEVTQVAEGSDFDESPLLIYSQNKTYSLLDIDNNGFVDIYSEMTQSGRKETGVYGYIAYQKPGRKFEIKKIDYNSSDQYYGYLMNGPLFMASDGRRYSVKSNGGSIATPNERPAAPTAVRHLQNSKSVIIEWEPSIDKETPAVRMCYNISIKHKGMEGEDAYLFSPCNGGKNGVPVPTGKQLLSSTRLTIPIASIPAGEYEVKVQGVDLMRDASDFSEVYMMKVVESCGIELPATGEVGYPVTVRINSNTADAIDWDGAEIYATAGSWYTVIWRTAGHKCVTVGGESASIYVREAPDASFSLPETCHLGDRINVAGRNIQNGDWEIRLANSPYDWEELSASSASRFATLDIIDAENATLTFKVTNKYEIRHSVSEGFATVQHIAATSVGERRAPEITLVDIDDTTGKHRIRWNAAPQSDILGINLYKETSVAGKYTLLAKVPVASASFVDLESSPDAKASRYLMTYELTYGESADGTAHQPIHVMINRGVGTSWNLIWTKYEGIGIDTYRILRGNSPETLAMIDEVSGNMTSYCDANPPAGPLCYAVEIIDWGASGHAVKSVNDAKNTLGTSRSNVVVAGGDASVNLVREIVVYSVSGGNAIDFSNETYLDLGARVYPYNATFMSPAWIITAGEDIATVDARGRVTATGRGNGEVTVRACAIDGSGVSGEFTLNVSGVDSGVDAVETSGSDKLTVYPAVAEVEIHLSGLPADDNGRSQLYIFGMNGMLVYQDIVTGQSATVNCSSFADGVYVIKAVGNRGASAARFIKR